MKFSVEGWAYIEGHLVSNRKISNIEQFSIVSNVISKDSGDL